MVTEIRHIALRVPDLRKGEYYYQNLFAMKLVGRETCLEDDIWYTIPLDKSWEEVNDVGVEVKMLALRRNAFVLALFPEEYQNGGLYMIGLNMNPRDIKEVRKQLSIEEEVLEDEPDSLMFRDRYNVVWQIYPAGTEFRSSGEHGGRWINI